jgi:hypothetical protein
VAVDAGVAVAVIVPVVLNVDVQQFSASAYAAAFGPPRL